MFGSLCTSWPESIIYCLNQVAIILFLSITHCNSFRLRGEKGGKKGEREEKEGGEERRKREMRREEEGGREGEERERREGGWEGGRVRQR